MNWLCPKCRSPLQRQQASLVCENGHAYDYAKQGYCNLLLANKKSSKQPGDSKEMILARRAFLQNGHYAPLLEKMAASLGDELLPPGYCLLDMGCGEGYYLRGLAAASPQAGHFLGIDISKEAVRRAAASDKHAKYAVASCYDIPLPDASVDIAVSVFSPLCERELSRVLKPNGRVLRVSPGAQHLWALKQRLYEAPANHTPLPAPEGLARVGLNTLQYTLSLQDAQDIRHLLQMTPYFWRGKAEAKAQLTCLDEFAVGVDFRLELFKNAAEVQVEYESERH